MTQPLPKPPATRQQLAYDTGDGDAYYGRNPVCRIRTGNGLGPTIPEDEMSPKEREAFWQGYSDNPCGQKDWG